MSERPHPDDSTPSSSNVAVSASYATTPIVSATQDSQQRLVPQRYESTDGPLTRQLPPPPPPRSSSFSNLLNPAHTEDDAAQNRRRKASELDSPPGGVLPLQSSRLRQSPGPVYLPGPSEPRRILTPRSPSLHRAASMGQLSGPTGTIDAQQQPFVGSPLTRTYTAEPGTAGVPPMPARSYTAYAPPPASDRRTSSSTLDHRPRSPSISPRTNYAQQGPPRNSPMNTSLPSLSNLQYSAESDSRAVGVPISSTAGPNVYQMMALQTSAGTVHLPVDVQAASKVADEKRKRNAGASARFRARRKEKEKESTSTISKLEMQLKDLTEDLEFYRRERNYLANVVNSIPGGDRHFPRPPSPRHRRASIGIQASISGSSDYLSGQDAPRSPGDRNVRRRVSGLPMAAPQPPQSTAAGPSNYAQYEQPQYTQPLHAPLPGPASLLQHHPSQPAQTVQQHPTSQPQPSQSINASQGHGWSSYNDTRTGKRPER